MGLGKTLTTISLVATDIDPLKLIQPLDKRNVIDQPLQNPTLIIVPSPLLGTWEEEIAKHVFAGGLLCRQHYGKMRLHDLCSIPTPNIILTTYGTVSAEWRKERASSILFSHRWKRVILDEGHTIRNSHSQVAQAICALDAQARWAVTGTPIHNRLADFAALLKFLRVYPYSDSKRFERDVSNFWKAGDAAEGARRLKRLSRCLLLRRPKHTVELPFRKDCNVPWTSISLRENFIMRSRASSLSNSRMSVLSMVVAIAPELLSMFYRESKPCGSYATSASGMIADTS